MSKIIEFLLYMLLYRIRKMLFQNKAKTKVPIKYPTGLEYGVSSVMLITAACGESDVFT